eukprot:CCRYP_011494-RA/>CCRYP_011494-RA protein AED:0.24 eAED:0.24 QI:0/-1/0/1/-1/1/1/0/1178
MQTTAKATIDPKKAEPSKVSFDASHMKPSKIESVASTRRRMFVRRKAKSQDDDDNEDEAEIKRLQRKVEYLEKKKKLVQKIKKIERGIDAVDVESDDDTSSDKQKVSPKRWPSFRVKRWKNRDRSDSYEDDLTSDDEDNSPLLQKVHSALDYIEDTCSPIVNDLKLVCTDLLASLDNGHLLQNPKALSDVEGSSDEVKTANEGSISTKEHDVKPKTEESPGVSQVSSLATMITTSTKQISQSFSRSPDADVDLKENDPQLQEESAITNGKIVVENNSTRILDEHKKDNSQIRSNSEQALGWSNNAEYVFSESSQSAVLNKDGEDVGLGSCTMVPAKSTTDPAIKPGDARESAFAKVTLTAMTLSGLSILSKTNEKCAVPPVHAVLSVLKTTTSEEGSVFTHVPSLRVVNDASRGPMKKNKFDRSAKYHVMGVWDLSKNDESSVTFSRYIGQSTLETIKKREVTVSPSILHLRLCIKREDREDILPVGVAEVPLSGWENRDVELAVPVKPEYYKSFSDLTKKLNTKPPQSKWESLKTFVLEDDDDVLSRVRFKGFKNESYRLEKDSCIRIRLKITSDPEEQQSHLSAHVSASDVAINSESHVFTVSSKPMVCQDTQPPSMSEGPRAVETTQVISDAAKPSVKESMRKENYDRNGADSSGVAKSFGQVVTQVEEVTYTPSINNEDPCLTVITTDNKENTSNGVVLPLQPVDGLAEKIVSQSSQKPWFKKSKMTKPRKTKVSSRSQQVFDKKLDSEKNPDGVAEGVNKAFQDSRELENDKSQPVKYSSPVTVKAEPTLLNEPCPEITTNNATPVDADTTALPQLQKKIIDRSQAEDGTGLKGSNDAHLQATGEGNVDSYASDLLKQKQPGKDTLLKSNKSWFKKTPKIGKTDPPPSLCSARFKEPVAFDRSLALASSGSYDHRTLIKHETVGDNSNIYRKSPGPNAHDIIENNSQEISRSVSMTSLKTEAESNEDSLHVVDDKKTSSGSSAQMVNNLSLPAAVSTAETPVSTNENSAGLQSNCGVVVRTVDEVHAEIVKSSELDIVHSTNPFEADFPQLVEEYEFEVTPEDFLKAATMAESVRVEDPEPVSRPNSYLAYKDNSLAEKRGNGFYINGSDHIFKCVADNNHECRCEDCTHKRSTLLVEEEGECEGIELELKKKARKSVLRIATEGHSKQKKTF